MTFKLSQFEGAQNGLTCKQGAHRAFVRWARPASPPLPEIESKYHHHNLCLVFFKMTHKLSAGKGFQSPNVVFFKKSEVTERNTKAVKRIKTVFITILVTIGSFLCIFGFLLVSTGLCRLWKFCRNFWTIYIYDCTLTRLFLMMRALKSVTCLK